MAEIILGILAVLIGALFAIQGGNIMRVLFPFMGFIIGFSAGAGMVSAVTGDGFLSTFFSWVVGFCIAILFALLSYFFYAFAVVLAFAGFGFSLTAAILSIFNLDWNWLVILAGTFTAVVFGFTAVVTGLPMAFLMVITSFFGSALVIYGILLVFNIANFGDFSSGQVYRAIRSNLGLYMFWVVMGVSACVTQFRVNAEQTKLAQEYWDSSQTLDEFIQNKKQSTKKSKK